jgi:hypothetical protein
MFLLTFDQRIGVASAIGAVCTFGYSYYTWRDKSENEFQATRAEARHAAVTRRIEATKPFLCRQLDRYISAIRIVAALVTSDDEMILSQARRDFWGIDYRELAP